MTNYLKPDSETLRDYVFDLCQRAEADWERWTPYQDYFRLRSTEFLLLMLKLQKWWPDKVPANAMEIGCGIGFNALLLSKMCERVTGCDMADPIKKAREMSAALGVNNDNVKWETQAVEELAEASERYDLLLTQYVLEHVEDRCEALQTIRRLLTKDGLAIHLVPNQMDRVAWRISYRLEYDSLRWRLKHSIHNRGLWKTLKDPFGYTPPHDGTRGDFNDEFRDYKLEKWAEWLFESGFVILDYFQTRDNNWVFVTRRSGVSQAR
jgi:SAM-dependent methyltransferase